jgi:RNA polymerase sigma factor (sigma-70 family)
MAAAAPSRPALRGDEEILYRAHHRRLLRLVAMDVGARPQVIEDACAYAWTELITRQPERTSIIGWLRVVARHQAIRLAQRDRRTVSLHALAPMPAQESRATTCPPSDATEHNEALRALGLVARLPERKRASLALQLAGYSYDEIAAELEMTRRTVERQLRRARAEVRALR